MNTATNTTAFRLLSVGLLALIVAFAPAYVAAQDGPKKEKKSVTIKIEDDRVWINGEEMPDDMELKEYLEEMGYGDIDLDLDGKIRIRRGLDNVYAFDFDDAKKNVFFRGPDHEFEFDTEGLSNRLMHLGEPFAFFGSSPEIMKKEQESRSLARRVRNAEGNERAELERELDALLSEIFEAKLESRRERITELQEKLDEQQSALQERLGRRAEIIERRKAELLGEDSYDW